MSKISVAFFGSHPLGEQCLKQLTNHEQISVELVVTYPENEHNWWSGNLYRTASEMGHNVVTISEERTVLGYPVDYLISVYYPNIIDSKLLNHPKEAPVNLHQAELPRYRGSNVFTHSILNAREDDYWKHGTTFHVMAEEVDAGDIIDRRFVDIEKNDTAWSLYEKVREQSVQLFEDMLPVIIDRQIDEVRTPQSAFDGPRYFYPKTSINGMKKISINDIRDGDTAVYDLIRALDFPPHEPAYTEIQNEKVYLTLNGYQKMSN